MSSCNTIKVYCCINISHTNPLQSPKTPAHHNSKDVFWCPHLNICYCYIVVCFRLCLGEYNHSNTLSTCAIQWIQYVSALNLHKNSNSTTTKLTFEPFKRPYCFWYHLRGLCWKNCRGWCQNSREQSRCGAGASNPSTAGSTWLEAMHWETDGFWHHLWVSMDAYGQ